MRAPPIDVAESDRWHRLNEIFHASLALDPERRAAYLAEAWAGDAVLREQVEGLLRADESAEQFLETGRQFGPYRAVEEIGGGMGAVYLAERADGQFAASDRSRPDTNEREPR